MGALPEVEEGEYRLGLLALAQVGIGVVQLAMEIGSKHRICTRIQSTGTYRFIR